MTEIREFVEKTMEQAMRDDLPVLDENTEEITVKAEDLIDIPEGIEMMHMLDKPIRVNII